MFHTLLKQSKKIRIQNCNGSYKKSKHLSNALEENEFQIRNFRGILESNWIEGILLFENHFKEAL